MCPSLLLGILAIEKGGLLDNLTSKWGFNKGGGDLIEISAVLPCLNQLSARAPSVSPVIERGYSIPKANGR